MSQNLALVCTLLIEDIYGPFLSEIFSTLTSHGRLPINHLAQRCHLPLRHVRSGLGALIQLRLVHHHTTFDGRTTYEANTKVAYNILRTGRLLQTIHRNFGPKAAKLMKKLTALGQASASSLLDESQSPINMPSIIATNGTDHGGTTKTEQVRSNSTDVPSIQQLLHCLSEEEYIIQVRDSHFQNWCDARQDAELHVRQSEQSPIVKGKLAQQILDDKIDGEMSRRARASLHYATADHNHGSQKRPGSSQENFRSLKRPRLGMNHARPEETRLDSKVEIPMDDMVLCVNYGKAANVLRNEKLTSRVNKQAGNLAAHVYAGAILQLEGVRDPGENLSSHPLGVHPNPGSLIQVNTDQLLLDTNARDFPLPTISYHDARDPTKNGHTNGHSLDRSHEPISPDCIERQLEIVSEGDSAMISCIESTGKWVIDVQLFRSRLLKAELFHYIRNRFGVTALRIIRILDDKGKVDEKWLQEIGLLSARDLRQSLATLHANGFIELQEIPREPQRQPNRTMFLWFFDLERAQRVLLEDIYKSMARLQLRMKLERQTLQSTLDKVDRSDVRGKEESLLAPEEMNVLKQWRKRERWLLGELSRLDDIVILMDEP